MKPTVIIPTLNEEKYLPATLESLRRQTLDLEIIIVDSFSTDNTIDIAEEYGARIIQVPAGNIGLARHIGAECAKTKYVLHTSADVIHESEWAEKHLTALDTADVTFGPVFLQNPKAVEKFAASTLAALTPIMLKFGLVFGTADNLGCKKDFFLKLGGMANYKTAEDILFLKKAIYLGSIKFVNAKIFTHPRRIRKWGTWRYFVFHTRNFLKANFLGTYEKNYEPIR